MLKSKTMKQRATTPAFKGIATKSTLVAAAVMIAIATPMTIIPNAFARDYDAEIRATQSQIDQFNTRASELNQQANTLQNELAKIGAERATIQARLDLSQAKFDKLTADIKVNEQKIAENKDALGTTLADMYVDNSITPLEMIASSKNIGDYVDKQSYQASVSDQLQNTIKLIDQLKKQLEQQKVDVERVLADQNQQKSDLVAKENERQSILSATKGEEAAYQKLSGEKKAQIDQLRAAQAAENLARAQASGGNYTSLPGDGSRGGYPTQWANAPMNAYVDSWGMYSRQCVSYAAFKVNQAYGNMPYWGGIGNAYEWDDNARNQGIKTSRTPAAGTVGVSNAGSYGHVAWVESVNANGTINISQYNVGWGGEYSVWNNLDPGFFDTYIYFGG